ncbi:DegT/DnrJ/EryC1/StrS family aminotransferase [Shouchella shacheensis]|uniref:DegT/DnrJ/EryC1/StrS family aminotransferase n=1 Tax=Shouchella shacheensis TaxID=1649580 RepID=UPI000B05ABD7|nr:DegT/DnrJ/EryC1/StrS family aminotransferase [Shouchella shacheensis]
MENPKLIPMVDLKKELEILKPIIISDIAEVLDSGTYILGKKGEQFEKRLADYVGTTCAVGVANGTDALYLALKALDIKPGDEVITTPFTFFATGEAIAQVGAKPVFVDIDEESYNIDPTKIEEVVSPKTKAIIVVHLFGRVAKMNEILRIAQAWKIKVIEDACQAIGTEYEGRRAGAIGDIGCFSFFPSKSLGAFGDAGAVVTNNQDLYEKVCELRNHGSTTKYAHESIGINSRLDEIQAAILLTKLNYLDIFLHKRKEIARRYTEQLHREVKAPPIVETREHTFHQYCIKVDRREELAVYLKNKGISSAVYYPIPLHLQEAFHYLHYKGGDFPIAEKTAKHILALPISPELSIEQQNKIIAAVRTFFKTGREEPTEA